MKTVTDSDSVEEKTETTLIANENSLERPSVCAGVSPPMPAVSEIPLELPTTKLELSVSQAAQPPLPSSVALPILPPLPPGPSPPSESKCEGLSTSRSQQKITSVNGTREVATTQLPLLASFVPESPERVSVEASQKQFGLELQYGTPYTFKDNQLPHVYAQHSSFDYQYPTSQSSDTYFPSFSYFPYSGTQSSMSVPPPLFPITQPNFSFPPPLLEQHSSSLEPHIKIGIPFPPPGYHSNPHSSHDIPARDARPMSKVRRSRSKSPSHSSSRSNSRPSHSASHRRRSRSRSYRRKSRSRSRPGRSSRVPTERTRRSRSRSYRKRSRTPQQKSRRSRSTSRFSQCSRSASQPKRRSRSPSPFRKSSKSIRQPLRPLRSPLKHSKPSRPRSPSLVSKSNNFKSEDVQGTSLRVETSISNGRSEDRSRTSGGSVKHTGVGNCKKDDSNCGKSRESSSSMRTTKKIKDSLASETKRETVALQANSESLQSYHSQQSKSERESLVERWRLNNCKNLEEMANKLDVLSKMEADEIIELEKQTWTRSAPADLYYKRHSLIPNLMEATPKLLELCEQFDMELVQRAERERQKFPPHQPRKAKFKMCKHTKEDHSSSTSSCEDSSSDEEDKAMMELERKRKHPQRLHPELWHNEIGEMNDGPLCRCSHRARRSGIRHNVYVGEQKLEKCNINTNNAGKLYHYRITMSPPVNFLTKTPTIIEHDSHEYIFEGFSMLSHFPLVKLPTCKVIRFNIEYTILYVDEAMPENFTIRELDLFYKYLFHEILELIDLDLRAFGDPAGCNQFHFMPRFVRDLPENGKEILSMNEVLKYLLKSNKPLVPEERLNEVYNMSLYDWQTFADEVKCMVVTKPGMKPCSLRVDQLDRETMDEGRFPEIVHFGIRPPQLSYAGNTEYQKHWREYVKFRHLLANMPKPSPEDKRKLMGKENRLQEMRTVSKMKRDVTIALSSQGFYRSGIMCDIIQHALLLPVLVCHLRFHKSLDQLEEDMDYKFKNRYLLQLALTHPSYRENFGTNPDHARNSLTNCGIRQPEYGDRRIHYMNTRKRGINTLIQIMSRFGKKEATESNIGHNERLEFLGDAVVEFITSIHLFHLFPDLEEGGLATYRAAIVQNQHLAVMAKRLNLDAYMLYAHGSDLCHDLELRHAMANCFEALMGALFLDGGIEVADKVFGSTLWKEQSNLTDVWMNYPLHPLQEQEPAGDRQWIQHFPVLQKLTEFEKRSGIVFKHMRLLARAFTDRSVGYTNLTLGSNQRLEFLGDTVLQIIASEYLYKFFPEHHEGHLSLLRSSLVNNRTQAVVCDDLGMTEFALYANPKHDVKTKDRADLLEAYLGALYIDKGLKHCHLFCEVCFFPRLQDFIMNQDWNDPKSKLQQCCLTLRTMEGGEPDIPVYKVIQCMGPTNTRIYTVAVYFRGERLAQASGHSIQQAEMNAANEALELSTELFPQLDHQRRVIAKSMKKQKKRARREAAMKASRELEMRALEARSRTQERNHRSFDRRDRGRSHRLDDNDREGLKLSSSDRSVRGSIRDRESERRGSRERDRPRSIRSDRDRERQGTESRDFRGSDRERESLTREGRERNLIRDTRVAGGDRMRSRDRTHSRDLIASGREEKILRRDTRDIRSRDCQRLSSRGRDPSGDFSKTNRDRESQSRDGRERKRYRGSRDGPERETIKGDSRDANPNRWKATERNRDDWEHFSRNRGDIRDKNERSLDQDGHEPENFGFGESNGGDRCERDRIRAELVLECKDKSSDTESDTVKKGEVRRKCSRKNNMDGLFESFEAYNEQPGSPAAQSLASLSSESDDSSESSRRSGVVAFHSPSISSRSNSSSISINQIDDLVDDMGDDEHLFVEVPDNDLLLEEKTLLMKLRGRSELDEAEEEESLSDSDTAISKDSKEATSDEDNVTEEAYQSQADK